MSGSESRDRQATEEVRQRLVWLSAQEAAVRNLGYTRPFTVAEHARLARLATQHARLLRILDQLTGRPVAQRRQPVAPRPRPPRASTPRASTPRASTPRPDAA